MPQKEKAVYALFLADADAKAVKLLAALRQTTIKALLTATVQKELATARKRGELPKEK